MKNRISILAIAMFVFSFGVANAQEVKQEKKKATTETITAEVKTEVVPAKKECTSKAKKCCAAKKEEEAKS